jgi:hypothetical protein
MTGYRSRDTCRDLSKTKNSTSLLTMYTVTSVFVVDNKNKFKSNFDVYHINTRQKCNMTNSYKIYHSIKKDTHRHTSNIAQYS